MILSTSPSLSLSSSSLSLLFLGDAVDYCTGVSVRLSPFHSPGQLVCPSWPVIVCSCPWRQDFFVVLRLLRQHQYLNSLRHAGDRQAWRKVINCLLKALYILWVPVSCQEWLYYLPLLISLCELLFFWLRRLSHCRSYHSWVRSRVLAVFMLFVRYIYFLVGKVYRYPVARTTDFDPESLTQVYDRNTLSHPALPLLGWRTFKCTM